MLLVVEVIVSNVKVVVFQAVNDDDDDDNGDDDCYKDALMHAK